MGKYDKHKKDPRTGARFSFDTETRRGKTIWVATWTRGGRRNRRRGETKAELEDWMREELAKLETEGVEAAELTLEERRDALAAQKLLAKKETLTGAVKELLVVRELLGNGVKLENALTEIRDANSKLAPNTIADAVAFWCRHHQAAGVTLATVASGYIKDRALKRPSYFRNVKSKCGILLRELGEDTPAAEIMVDDLRRLMDGRGEAVATKKAWRTFLLDFFQTAVDDFGVESNPASGLKAVKGNDVPTDADVYTVEEVERLARAAEAEGPTAAVGMALLLWAGLRPNELTGCYTVRGENDTEGSGEVVGGLQWRFVGDKEIVVTRATSKTKSYRRIPVSRNLKAWLKAYAPSRKSGPVIPNPTWWRRTRERIAEQSGVEWKADGARHSFASYHWALHQNRAELEAAMGHTGGTNTLERYYEAFVDKKDAKRFWSIMPNSNGMSQKGGRK